jgi:hypothetical protein
MTFLIKTCLVTLISNLIEITFFQSFLKNNIFKTNDIWVKNNKTCVENQTVFNRWKELDIRMGKTEIKINTRKLCKDIKIRWKRKMKNKSLEKDSNLNIWNQNNKIIVRKELKLKNSQTVIHKSITPKCQLNRNTFHEKKFNWISIWYILNNTCKQSISQFQWKWLHNIVY